MTISQPNSFRLEDFNFKRNKAFEELRGPCSFCRPIVDWSFHRLCSHPKNTSKIIQNENGDKRCALPWCPREDEVEKIHREM